MSVGNVYQLLIWINIDYIMKMLLLPIRNRFTKPVTYRLNLFDLHVMIADEK